jgi:mono/diheme cytochrome c family protein
LQFSISCASIRAMRRLASIVCLLAAAACATARAPRGPSSGGDAVVVPRLWDDEALATWATPVAGLGVPPGFVSAKEYYAAPVDNVRTYPVYLPGREPAGYLERLRALGPKRLIEPETLHTRADWIEAGRRVFEELDTAVMRSSDPAVLAHFRDGAALDAHRDAAHDAVDANGVLLDYRWVVARDGSLQIGMSSCAGCHTRLMPDGSLLRGAPCNFDLGDSPAVDAMLARLLPVPIPKGQQFYEDFGVPWVEGDVHAHVRELPDDEVRGFSGEDSGAPPGTTFARVNGSPYFVTRMADLIGVKDRRYLDTTGTHLNRGPEDVARYGILVEFADARVFGPYRMTETQNVVRVRPPDEAMYALGLYLYSLEPPKSPYPVDDVSRRGQAVFEAQGCGDCHTPPLYTNNKLIPVTGFQPDRKDPATARLDISMRRVGTDPGLALRTRKGTGYYRVPSLRGLWYRGLYEHSGSLRSLDDWFDPRRLRDDYVPTGWRGPGVATRAVPGHEFGLDLPDDDKKALIAFLRTI